MKKLFFLLMISLLLSSCTALMPAYTYSYEMVSPASQKDLRFTDDKIDVFFVVGTKQVNFVLLNKLEKPIKIDWQNVMLVVNGEAKKVMHAGVKYADRNEQQPATTIPPGSKVEDLLMPTDNVYYVSGQYGGWRELPIFPNKAQSPEELEVFKGSELGVYFPVVINDETVDYNFKFKVTGVERM